MLATNTSEADTKGEPGSNWWLKFGPFAFSFLISVL